jgi:hypothetical protein
MTAPAPHQNHTQGQDDKNYPVRHEGPEETQPGQFVWGTLNLPTPKDDQPGPPATYPLGAGSDPVSPPVTADSYNREAPRMPPVNSDNYGEAAAADKGSEIKGSAETKIKSHEAQETEKQEEQDKQDKAKFQTGHNAPAPAKPAASKK